MGEAVQKKREKKQPFSIAHLIQLGLLTRKRESEAQGKFFLLYVHFVHEISQTVNDVVK